MALTLGCIVAGRLIDWLGSGVTFMGGSVLLALTTWDFYSGLQGGTADLLLHYAQAGFCVGIVGAVPYVMVNAFPAAVRFSGLSFSYNVAYAVFGGLTPMLVTLWVGPGCAGASSMWSASVDWALASVSICGGVNAVRCRKAKRPDRQSCELLMPTPPPSGGGVVCSGALCGEFASSHLGSVVRQAGPSINCDCSVSPWIRQNGGLCGITSGSDYFQSN